MLAHLPRKSVRKNTKHVMSHSRKAITTWGKTWSARGVKTKATAMRSRVILNTSTMLGMTTVWSHNLRPSTLRHGTSRPSTAPLNRRHMYAMGRAVHVPVFQLIVSPLISLPPKAKLSKVTIPMVVVTVIPHLSLGWLLAHSLVGIWFTLGGCLALGRGSSEMFGRVSSGLDG